MGGVLGSRMLQLHLQLPLVYPKLSSLAGEAEVFVLRVIGGDGPVVLGKPPPPSVRLASRLLGLVGASPLGSLAIHTLLTPGKWHQNSCWPTSLGFYGKYR